METEAMNVDLKEPDKEELRLLYDVSVSDIVFFKQQQLSVTNYALALHAAFLFIAYQLLVAPLAAWQLWLLVVLTWTVCLAGLEMVVRLQCSILGRRTRLEQVRAHFGKPFFEAWTIQKPKDDVYQLLISVMLLSSGVVTGLVLVKA